MLFEGIGKKKQAACERFRLWWNGVWDGKSIAASTDDEQ